MIMSDKLMDRDFRLESEIASVPNAKPLYRSR
jgi:hypothetical protein